MIQLEEISKRYGDQVVLDGVSWHIGRRRRYGLVGPNGSGKTTLCRIITGGEFPDSGKIRKAKDLTVGFLPQDVMEIHGQSVLGHVLEGYGNVGRLEAELGRMAHKMSSSEGRELARLMRKYGELQQRFEIAGGYEIEAKAKVILGGLGFGDDEMDEPLEKFSGGWQMRAVLAGLLLREPDLLLLDEPTNHLDIDSIVWLESFLGSYKGTYIVISHDRYFLNRMIEEIAGVENGCLRMYAGNYDLYLSEREREKEDLMKTYEQQQRRIREIRDFIDRNRARKDRAKQVQSRIKMLEKMDRVEIEKERKKVRIRIHEPERSGANVLTLRGIKKAYGASSVYDGVDFNLRRGEKVALVGPNGHGKTTLLKILAGEIPYDGGERVVGYNVRFFYYAQHQLEQLHPDNSILEELEGESTAEELPYVRGILGLFLFSGDEVQKRISALSGGEKSRVALSKMLLRPYNLLLFDEPTNHLDIPSRVVLEEALRDFPGTICFTSHDRYFINKISTRVCEIRNGGIESFPGDYDYYMEKSSTLKGVEKVERADPPRVRERGGERDESGVRHRLEKSLKEEVGKLGAEIEQTEEELKVVEEILSDRLVYKDSEKVKRTVKEGEEKRRKLLELYRRWEELVNKME